MEEAVRRRLRQELGLTSDLQFLYKFQYQASYEDMGAENEICWVHIGVTDDRPRPNPNEIENHRWVTPARLDDEMAATPEIFTPWFQMEWERVRDAYSSKLGL
jgi:isopentenyl-diphosphate delta-isomerase